MKFILAFLMYAMAASAAAPEQSIISSATLKVGDESLSTPKAELHPGLEAVRRSSVMINGRKYIFGLRSSAFEKNGKYAYSVALSLSDSGKDEFIAAKSGETKVLEPMTFVFVKDGVACTAIVNLVPK